MKHHGKPSGYHPLFGLPKHVIYLLAGFLLITSNSCYANNYNISEYFKDNTGCFILYDLTNNKLVEHYNPTLCAKRISAHSTFKVPLSLMAFDQHLITQNSTFKWDRQHKYFEQWNHNQTPKTWLQYSVVWVSQQLTPQLGMKKITQYLNEFHYGNCDFSGNTGKNDGLMQAWLSSSLKISADEQLEFLINLVTKQLPIKISAMKSTEENMFIETTKNGSKLFGKTGSGHGSTQSQGEGWFVGFIQNSKHQYIFVTNVQYDRLTTKEYGGHIAKKMTIDILKKMHLI